MFWISAVELSQTTFPNNMCSSVLRAFEVGKLHGSPQVFDCMNNAILRASWQVLLSTHLSLLIQHLQGFLTFLMFLC